jgi:hypothetical protein
VPDIPDKDGGSSAESTNSQNANSSPKPKKTLWQRLIIPTDTSVAISTWLLVIVGGWGLYLTTHSLELSERAWLSVAGMQTTYQPMVGNPIYYRIGVQNTGKEPATDVHIATQNGTVDPNKEMNIDTLDVPENKTCSGLKPQPGGIDILPTGVYGTSRNSAQGDNGLLANQDIIDGKTYYLVEGCYAYRTFEATHHTAFCQVYVIEHHPDGTIAQQFYTCKSGNYVD